MSLVTPPKLRRLQEALYTKAKQEPGDRFYLLYDKADIVAHADALSKQHGGAPGVDGVTFEDIEGEGLEGWLAARLTRRLAACLEDDRQPAKVRHQAIELVRPRVFGLRRVVAISVAASAAGGRGDPQAQVGRDPIAGPALASQPTLSLFENAVGATLDRAPAIA